MTLHDQIKALLAALLDGTGAEVELTIHITVKAGREVAPMNKR